MAYLPLWKIEAKIEFAELIESYGYQFARFDRVMDKLFHYRLAFDHGKRKEVASLTPTGVAYAIQLLKLKKYPKETENIG